jgi:2,4-diaminopentanoate dehydrogenase
MIRYRVVQWATGPVGRRALAGLIEHPEIELVGCYVHSADKRGRDAGEIAGAPLTGIAASDDVDTLIALKPDCVCYMPQRLDRALVVRLLRAGINVVSTCDGLLTGTNFPPHVRNSLDTAAHEGGATFMGTGFDPGFANLLTGFLTGACRRVQSVKLFETLDCTTYANPAAWRAIGFGRPIDERRSGPLTLPADASAPRATPDLATFFDTLDLVADMLAVELDKKEAFVERAAATRDIDLGWMQLPRGTLAGHRRTYVGYAHGRALIEVHICWTMSNDALDETWNAPEGYRIEVEGEPRVHATIAFEPSRRDGISHERDVMSVLLVGTAMAAVHAIPFVCAAPPGFTTPARLPVIGARHAVI